MKQKKLWLFVILAVLLTTVGLFLWDIYASKPSGAGRVICIPKIVDEDNDFWVQLLEGVRMAAQENGAEVTIRAAAREDSFEEQIEIIYWAIEQKPDAIVLVPSSYTRTAQAVEDIIKSGIPLVLADSDVAGEEEIVKVATDNVKAGRIQGEYMKEFLDEDSQIAIVCHVEGSSTAREREQGMREGLGEYSDQITDVVFCDSDYDKAYQLMNEILDRHPKVDMVAGLNEYSAVGAARAIIDRGLQEEIQMVGFDSSLEQIRLLEEGVFEGIVIQNPYKMGYLAMEAACKLIRGEEVETSIDSGAKLITREEVFTEENQKILFMFTEE